MQNVNITVSLQLTKKKKKNHHILTHKSVWYDWRNAPQIPHGQALKTPVWSQAELQDLALIVLQFPRNTEITPSVWVSVLLPNFRKASVLTLKPDTKGKDKNLNQHNICRNASGLDQIFNFIDFNNLFATIQLSLKYLVLHNKEK